VRGSMDGSASSSLTGQRHAYHEHRPFACQPGEVKSPADELGPFAHAQETQRARPRALFFRNASAVVPHFDNVCALFLRYRDVHSGGLGMPENIGQSFLKNAEDGCGLLLAHATVFDQRIDLADDARAGLKLLRLP
jgi:hypothetical protein